MDWNAIGAAGEAIGAAGVIASLLYLAAQVRAGRRASAVQAKLESTRLLNDYIDFLIRSPDLFDLLLRGRANIDSLSRDEYLRFSNMNFKGFWYFSAGHFQYRMGTLEEGDWHEIRATIRFWLHGDGHIAWWNKFGRDSFGAEFSTFIDSEIDRIRAETKSAESQPDA